MSSKLFNASNFWSVMIALLIAMVCLGIVALGLCFSGIDVTGQGVPRIVDDVATAAQVRDFCGACHMVPRPDLLPRRSWPNEINKAYDRYKQSGRKDLTVPVQAVIKDYFTRLSLVSVNIPNAPQSTISPIKFRSEAFELPATEKFASVSFLNTVKSQIRNGDPRSDLLICDMQTGGLNRISWGDQTMVNIDLAKLKSPDHVIACDFDRDGNQDFLVADLGMLKPTDELLGSVVLLRSLGEGQSFELITVLDGLGRVADVQLADLDGDGDNDFVVAEFGYEKVGRLLWLETLSINKGRPKTRLHVIDKRHGSIHAPVTDLDGDGDLDLIVMFSQEHEAIVGFLNDGHGHFEPRQLFQADNPTFGSSGLDLVDLDSDGDLDVLFTNGDTLDAMQLQPFHGVHWLENMGSLEFKYHHLTTLPGAMRAVAGDFDGDGDLDVAAVAFCPPLLRHQIRPAVLDTLLFLEQTSPRQFVRHSLDRSIMGTTAVPAGHMAVIAGDFDGDRDLDLAVGEFSPFESKTRRWFTVYWNQLSPSNDHDAATLKSEN